MTQRLALSSIPKPLFAELVKEPSLGKSVPLSYKLLWICEKCKGAWRATYYHRGVEGKGCPYCAGQKVLRGFNDLESQHPELAKEYSLANRLSAAEVTSGSGLRAIWNCSKCEQSYESIIGNRARLGRGCPYCAGKRPIPGKNDLKTLRPELAKEWGAANDSLPEDFTLFSNKRIFWRCSNDHFWSAAISSRASGKGCKSCSRAESKAEKELLAFIRSIYTGPIISNDRKLLSGQELDIYLPDVRLAIEYNGVFWHSDKFLAKRGVTAQELHSQKVNRCKALGVQLLYVWEDDWRSNTEIVKAAISSALSAKPDIHSILKIVSKG